MKCALTLKGEQMNTETRLYRGKEIPVQVKKGEPMSCENSLCDNIACWNCINYSTGKVHQIKLDYLDEKNRDFIRDEAEETAYEQD